MDDDHSINVPEDMESDGGETLQPPFSYSSPAQTPFSSAVQPAFSAVQPPFSSSSPVQHPFSAVQPAFSAVQEAFLKPSDSESLVRLSSSSENTKPLDGDVFKAPLEGEASKPFLLAVLDEGKGFSPLKSKHFELYPNSLSVSQSALSDTSSVLSPASSSENYNEPLNLSTDMEFTDSETDTRHPVCNPLPQSLLPGNANTMATPVSKVQLQSFSPQRLPQSMSPHHVSAGYVSPATSLHGNLSPTRSLLPEGFTDNISAIIPTSAVRVKVRSRHASFSTPPKSPADSQWRLFKVNKDMKEETFDDINGERNFTQCLTLKNATDAKLNVSDKEDALSQPSSCPSSPRHIGSPVRSLTSPARPAPLPSSSPARPVCTLPASSPRPRVEQRIPPHRSTTPSPSPPFSTPPALPARCVSPGPHRPNSFTLKRKIVEPDCASPPKRPCTMALGHRSPTVEYRARNHSPAPLSPLAVSSQSVPEGEVVRSVPIHLLDRIELMCGQYNDSDSSDDSPPRNNRQPG